jgi:hypothetical protein
MRLRSVLAASFSAILFLAVLESPADAQEPVEDKRTTRWEFGLGGWVGTQGQTTWAHNASSIPNLGDPTSKLTYKDVGTNIIEGTARLWMTPKWFGRLTGGFGAIGGGRLTDNDYLTADGGAPSSQTFSDIRGGSNWYVNADFGRRIVDFRNSRGYLDVFTGYQYWYQRQTASGLSQQICTPAGQTPSLGPPPGTQPLCNPNARGLPHSVDVITNTSNWHSIRVGGSVEYRFTRRLSVQSTIALIPVSILDNKDVHYLRGDLSQNPSLSMLGYGIGGDADVGARFMIVRNLFASVGYRVWWNQMVSGNVTFHNRDGSTNQFALTEFQSYRHGVTFGLNYSF